MSSIAALVRDRRRLLGKTLQQTADDAGCSKAYLSAIENQRLDNPPSRRVIDSLERALGFAAGQLRQLADWQRTPPAVRAQVDTLAAKSRAIAAVLRDVGRRHTGPGRDLDALYHSGQLQQWIDQHAANVEQLPLIGCQVPLINKVAAGYPREFTDLDYPARVADEYVSVPGLTDSDAFAARVVGDSMLPDYCQGDIVVFSPARPPVDGDDCFIRLLPEHRTTFKRVFFQDPSRLRLQPLNPAFTPQFVEMDQVSGLYPAVYRLQRISPAHITPPG